VFRTEKHPAVVRFRCRANDGVYFIQDGAVNMACIAEQKAGGLQIVLFNLNLTSSISTFPVMESPSHGKNIGYLES
jgi:hypothetical protein